ncbi:MAG: AraC family transcriptional regulator [Sutterellaceae bacterium]|nr:AraC family transcriptional regulator [Sutterellaceae bacterium]
MWRKQLACRQLSEEKRAVKEIAFDLGFGSVSAFSTAFRRELGVSPSEWLAEYQARLEDKLEKLDD